jgi:hypothetical protein
MVEKKVEGDTTLIYCEDFQEQLKSMRTKYKNSHIDQLLCPIKCTFLYLVETIAAQVSERQQINCLATEIFLNQSVKIVLRCCKYQSHFASMFCYFSTLLNKCIMFHSPTERNNKWKSNKSPDSSGL